MVELLIASTIGLIVLGVSIYIFTEQEDTLNSENIKTNLRAKGRHAIKVLTKELRMSGFGLPPGLGISAPDPLADGSTISFQTNIGDVRTTTPPSAGSGGTSGSNSISTVDGSGFSNNDNIIIYNPSYDQYEFNSVSGTPSASSIPLSSGLANSYTYGVNANLVTIHKYNDVTIALSGTSINKTVDGTTTALITDVSSTDGLAFEFYGETETSQLNTVGVTVNMVSPVDSRLTMQFKTDINLRN